MVQQIRLHQFSRKEILQAGHDFEERIKKEFGEIWKMPVNIDCKSCEWNCHSIFAITEGLWRMCQHARHAGARRGCGIIQPLEDNHILKFVLFYDYADLKI